MQPDLIPNVPPQRVHRLYFSITAKFWISHLLSICWVTFSIYISLPWLEDLSQIITFPGALFVITGIAYVPGYMNAFLIASLLFDRQPAFKNIHPADPVTLLIAAHNEEDTILNTLRYVSRQDYDGEMTIIVINNNSSDRTDDEVLRAEKELGINVLVLHEKIPGKFNALNHGLVHVTTPLVITLDADTLLHRSAVRFLVARLESSPPEVCAVAGSMLVRNSRETIWTRIQEWDYFLGIASIKRLQGLYQGTLVAQGAFSLYRTECIREIGGWPDAIGEDIVLTWRLLQKKWKVYFEPLAVAFTDAPTKLKEFVIQRARWARGMIEGLREIKPWHQPQLYTKYLTGINLIMPYLDFTYTFCWIPGLILACFGYFWIVGPLTILVLPLTLISFGLLYSYQKYAVFRKLHLSIRKNFLGFILFILIYQLIMSPVSVWGYLQEFFGSKRIW
ncbi:glycosyltransferase family 2 protein [Sporolactobacillus sp. KGMB 08714]|uniref:glycosyltransferase family 2 protein n=1 Tax=Sporolactobacillus sp. KGMB 08714 TaxID=3064704 RepID=UPI002FBD6EEE